MEEGGASSSSAASYAPQDNMEQAPEASEDTASLKFKRFSAPAHPNVLENHFARQDQKHERDPRRASEPPPLALDRQTTKPIALAVARGNYLQSAGELIPGVVARIAGNVVGLTGFGMGYAMGKLGHAMGGYDVADSGCLLAGCRGMLAVNGIFPTVICEYGDMELGPLPAEGPVRQELLRDTPLVVSNHVSHLDAAAILPVVLELPKFVSMIDVKNYPIFGSLGQDLDYIWVDRKSKDSRAKTLEAITRHTSSWHTGQRPLVVFPEGTTSNGSSLLEFRKGAFVSGRPVRPVLLKYTGSWDPASVDLREQPEIEPLGPEGAAARSRGCAPNCGGRKKPVKRRPPVPTDSPERISDQKYEQYTDADWAAQFAGHLAHTCVVFICRPYYPDDAERADAELYARNVRTLMLARLGELHAALDVTDPWCDPCERLRCWRRTAHLKNQIPQGMKAGTPPGSPERRRTSSASSSFPAPGTTPATSVPEVETADAPQSIGSPKARVSRNERRKSLQESLRGSWCESSSPPDVEEIERRASRASIAYDFLGGGEGPAPRLLADDSPAR